MQKPKGDASHILIDWGTSSFRLWCIDVEGDLLLEEHAPLGMSKLVPSDYEPILEEILARNKIKNDVPVLICGMAGAAQGWQNAKYIDVPTRLDDLASHAVQVNTQGRDVRIVPGLAQRSKSCPDVMRGEETLLLGALTNEFSYQSYCLPGTHSKWVQVKDNEVQEFQTFMTGELYALLSSHSTLSNFLQCTNEGLHTHPAFENAVKEISANPGLLSNMLFSVRSQSLVFQNDDDFSSCARLSGLLIGSELTAMRDAHAVKIGLISQGTLLDNYSSAMSFLEMSFEVIDSHDLALSGLKFIADKLW